MMPTERKPPLIIPPSSPPIDPSKSAAFIFIHGLGDDAAGVERSYPKDKLNALNLSSEQP
jgi:hypothetical protein